MALSAISWAVTGRCGDIDGVWIDPVTAQVIMTLRDFAMSFPSRSSECCRLQMDFAGDPRVSAVRKSPRVAPMTITTPETTHRPTMIIGIVCGTLAALAWAGGFVVAKHGIQVGFSPADLAFHRFFWSGLLILPYVIRDGLRDLDGVGWGRGFVM